jgi:Xaa-Pro aminopeptidase
LRKYACKNAEFHLYTDYPSFAKFVRTLKIKSLLIESDKLTIDEMNQYVKPLGINEINSFKSDELRQIKSAQELVLLQKAADIVCAGINHLKQ